MNHNSSIYIAGHNGMVGSAFYRKLKSEGFDNIITKRSSELDLTNQEQVFSFFQETKPEYVILCAAKVGGINANIQAPAEFLFDNLAIQMNVIHASHLHNVKKIIFLGSSCIYPKESPQPMKEEYLLSGKLEPTNEGYAIAKIAGLKLIEKYHEQYNMNVLSLMPCNLYGPNDHFDLEKSHVLSALVKRFVDAKNNNTPTITLWGTGIAKREFLHVNDLAEAMFFLLNNYDSPEFINIGCGKDISIKELALLIAKETEYEGDILWDDTKPNGMLKKCLDVSKMENAGFFPKISIEEGIKEMIKIYKETNTL